LYPTAENVDFGELLAPEIRAKHKNTTYDLMANIVHDGEPGAGKGTYRVHVLHKVRKKNMVLYHFFLYF
jgi:U4/U6.U5 tri-snRNP-associated protein 2